MFSQETFHTRFKGNLGENIACKFLERYGFRVIIRNYQKRWGEIDVVCLKDGVVNFFEVKSVTSFRGVGDSHRPEENVHEDKARKISRMIRTFFVEYGYPADSEFHFHVLCVYMDMKKRTASVKWLKDVIL